MHRRAQLVGLLVLFLAVAPLAWGLTGGRRTLTPGHFEARLCGGDARLESDPVATGNTVSAVVSMRDVRYRARATGAIGRRMLARHAGEVTFMSGVCRPLSATSARFERVLHVAGNISVSSMDENWRDSSLIARSSNRVRDWIAHGARTLPPDDRALFLGLVIGDDRSQPRQMVDDFRESGLAHLTAVSGQNVAYVVAIAGFVVRRLRPLARFVTTTAVIAWFVVMTRAEPSVLRAAAMAVASAGCFALGVRFDARRFLPSLVLALLVVDPMLAHSAGFALSVGATVGLVWMSVPLSRLCGDSWWGRGLSVTLAATCGTAPVSLLVFKHVSAVSILCNPLAVPVAGAVMLCGIPMAVVGGVLPLALARVVMCPLFVGVRLVWWIAHFGGALSPRGVPNMACWLLIVVAVVVRRRAVAG